MFLFFPFMMYSTAIVTTQMMALSMMPFSVSSIPNTKVKAEVIYLKDRK